MGLGAEYLGGVLGRVLSPMVARLPPACRSAQNDLSDTCRNVIGAIFMAIMTCAVVCAV